MNTQANIEKLSLLSELKVRLDIFRKVGEEAMALVNSNYKLESERLNKFKSEIRKKIGRLQEQKGFIFKEISKLKLRREIMKSDDFFHSREDFYNIKCSIDELYEKFEPISNKLREEKERLRKCELLITKLNFQYREQYLPYGERPFRTISINRIKKASQTLTKIESVLSKYLSYNFTKQSSEANRKKSQPYNSDNSNTKYSNVEHNNNERSENENIGNRMFLNTDIKSIDNKLFFLVDRNKHNVDFNTQTIFSLENEATEKKCDYIVFRIYANYSDFFKQNGYTVTENFKGFLSDIYLAKKELFSNTVL